MTTEIENKKTPITKKVIKKRVSKKAPTASKKKPTSSDEFSSIAKNVGTAVVILVALIVAIAPDSVWMAGPVVGAICIFGIATAYLASK